MISLLMLLVGCGPKQSSTGPQSMSLAPSANVHLRNSFDTDPSAYLGRFVKDSAKGVYDESSTMALACSEHVTYRRIDGGGVKYTELLEISSAASARLGVPLIADASGSANSNRIVRVSYELTGKMIGEIKDPAAFANCCKTSPDQCTGRYIGEFIEGRGAIYHQTANTADGQGSGTNLSSGAGGAVEFSHGTAWERGIEFPNPVFFAFKISETPYSQQAPSACTQFMNTLPPPDEGGIYLLGSTPRPAKDEATARRRALRDATMSAYQTFGVPPDIETAVPVEIQAREWCIDTQGDRVSAKVLAYAERPTTPPPVVTPPTPESTTMSTTTMNTTTPSPEAPTAAAPAAGRGPVGADALAQLQASISEASFSDDKIALLRMAGMSNTFTVAQVAALLGGFSFDKDKIEAISILRPNITDPQNALLLANGFTFSSDKQAVMALFQ